MKRAASALAALAAATVALAQQTTPPTPAEQRTSPAPQEQTTPPANSSARSLSEADKQTLMNKCLTQVQAANPNVPQKDIRAYCDQEIKSIASPR